MNNYDRPAGEFLKFIASKDEEWLKSNNPVNSLAIATDTKAVYFGLNKLADITEEEAKDMIDAVTGNLEDLTTGEKETLVGAINEVKGFIDDSVNEISIGHNASKIGITVTKNGDVEDYIYIDAASELFAGAMSAEDKVKLDEIPNMVVVDKNTTGAKLAEYIDSGTQMLYIDNSEGLSMVCEAKHTVNGAYAMFSAVVGDNGHYDEEIIYIEFSNGAWGELQRKKVVTEAPTDGIRYVRQNGAWVPIIFPPISPK